MEINSYLLALSSKRQQLNNEIKKIQKQLELVNNGIEAIKLITCKRCNGTGEIRCTDEAGSWKRETCEICNGTGIFINEEELCETAYTKEENINENT